MNSLPIIIDNLSADIAKLLNLAKMPAILGDQPPGSTTAAQLYDPTIPGNVWILEITSNGYSTKKSVRGPTSSTVAMRAGMPVLLKYDIDHKLAVDKIDFTAVQAAGGNPLQNNASDGQANAFVSTSSITTLICTPTAPPSTNVALFGWKPVIGRTVYDDPGALIALASFIPAAGLHCVAIVFVMFDFSTVEVFASTAKSTSDPISIADLQEAISQATVGSTAAWVWRLHDGQASIVDADRLMDLRNPWNVSDELPNVIQFTQSASVTVANTASETTLVGAGKGTLVMPANWLSSVGRQIRFDAWCHHSHTGAPTLQIRFKLGTTAVIDTGALSMTVNMTDQLFRITGTATVQTAGSSGKLMAQAYIIHEAAIIPIVSTTQVSIDLTAALTADLTAQWSTGSVSDTITCTNLSVEVLN